MQQLHRKTQSIITKDDYELSVLASQNSLLLRLVIFLSKTSKDVYELSISSIQDVSELGDNFDNLSQFRQYIRDINHVEVNTENKSIKILEQSKLKSKRKTEIVSLFLNFSETIKKDLGLHLVEQIFIKCKNREQLSLIDIRGILEDLGFYLSQSFVEKRQKRSQTNKRIQFLQEGFKSHQREIQKLYKMNEQWAKLNEEKSTKVRNNPVQLCRQICQNKIQFCQKELELMKVKLGQFIPINSQIEKHNHRLEIKFEQLQNFKKDMVQTKQLPLRQILERLNQRSEIEQKIKEDVANLNKKIRMLQNVNGRRVISKLVKTLKCDNKLSQYQKDFETNREQNIQLEEGVTEIPSIISQMVSLERLQIWNKYTDRNQISKLPNGFEKLQSLKSLKLQGCLGRLSEEQGKKISHLQELEINGSPITKLPGLQNFLQLKELTINYTHLSQFPNIFKLPHIKNINLSGNQITVIPTTIREMKELEQLHIGHNPLPQGEIKQLLKNIKMLKNLIKLSLCELNLIQIPNQLCQLGSLQYVDLSSNNFSKFPPSIGQLHKLTYIEIDNCNMLQELPSQIGKLSHLNKLGLTQKLVNLPPQINNLINLQQIFTYRSNNSLSMLPKQIGALRNLRIININSAKLTYIPIQLCNVVSLVSISLETNNISQLPLQIGKLWNLTYFDIRRNKLTKVPQSLGRLPKEAAIFLYGNPLDAPTKQFLLQIKKTFVQKLTF